MAENGLELPAKDQFVQALTELRKRGAIAQLGYQTRKETYGQEVADDVGMVPQVKPTSETLAELLGAIPGVELTPKARETMSKASSLIASSQALGADVLKEGPGLVGVDITFPRSENGVATIDLERVVDKQRVDIKLKLTPDGIFLGGSVGISEKDRQFINEKGALNFDAQGNIQEVYGGMKENARGVERLNVAKVVHSVTTAEGLSQPFNVQQMLSNPA